MKRALRSVEGEGSSSGALRDERLQIWAAEMARLEWSALILDADMNLAWVSDELRQFLGAAPDADLGVGGHIAQAYVRDVWFDTVHPDSQLEVFMELAPFVLHQLQDSGRSLDDFLPERFHPLLDQVEPKPLPLVWASSFQYVGDASGDPDGYRVDVCYLRMNDETGATLGVLAIFFTGVRPNLLALLARGDQEMYERMARLVEPGRHQAAVLFCDLHESMRLSRTLPTATYFKLVRALWTAIDKVVAEECGIVGKHAGDGASAFFLADDLGSASSAAAASIRAARRIHEVSEKVFRDTIESECLMKIGLHWGNGLYMGQLVPGGRLDVTALGDEVNETARVQECTPPGDTLVTKYLIEQLDETEAAPLNIDVARLSYKSLADLDTASDKGIKDAGILPVTSV